MARLSRVVAGEPADRLSDRRAGLLGRRELVCVVLCAVSFGLAGARFGLEVYLIAYLAFMAITVIACVVDVEHYRIPNRLTYPSMLGAAVVVPAFSVVAGDPGAMVGAGVGAAVFASVLGVAHAVSPRSMGLGDVKFAVLLGAALGWSAPTAAGAVGLVLVGLFVASLAGTIVGVVAALVRRRNAPFPFGPALAAGTIAALMLGPTLLGAA